VRNPEPLWLLANVISDPYDRRPWKILRAVWRRLARQDIFGLSNEASKCEIG
jgi:hypothetical protein